MVLVGVKRLQMSNRVDPEAFYSLATAYYDFDNDPTLRAAVLFGRGENLSRANNVSALPLEQKTGSLSVGVGQLDPPGRMERPSNSRGAL
jgi:enoyl-CoA hydratase